MIELAGRGLVLLDAAMGTQLIALGLDLASDDPCLWAVDRPDAVLDLHRRDVRAGSGAITTNTFGANRSWLARFGRADEAPAINRRAVALAREAAGPGRLVLGSIGPAATGADLLEQAEALEDAGADALVLETHRLGQAIAALRVLRPSARVPIIASLYAWQDVSARWLEVAQAAAIGVNCVVGMGEAVRVARSIRSQCRLPIPVWIKPSAGLPGGPIESPATFAASASNLFDLGDVWVGGCCGTTAAHVAALRVAIDAAKPTRG